MLLLLLFNNFDLQGRVKLKMTIYLFSQKKLHKKFNIQNIPKNLSTHQNNLKGVEIYINQIFKKIMTTTWMSS